MGIFFDPREITVVIILTVLSFLVSIVLVYVQYSCFEQSNFDQHNLNVN